MKNQSVIEEVRAMEILDSRGNPTVRVHVRIQGGQQVSASVPSGASTGQYEAVEMRDGDPRRYHGLGVLKAVQNINEVIAPRLIGRNAEKQKEIDCFLCELDGTSNKSFLGANAILGVSMAVAKAGASAEKLPLYEWLGGRKAVRLPMPMMNILNGGKHTHGGLTFQEFMIVPVGAPSFREALRYGAEIFHSLKILLEERGCVSSVGDEGGFVPSIKGPEEACELILKAAERAGYMPGRDICLALDLAATSFLQNGLYMIPELEEKGKTKEELEEFYLQMIQKYPIVSLEDGFAETDWDGFREQTKQMGDHLQIVGDDLFVTNSRLIKQGIREKSANAVLIKLNQIGTVSETIKAVNLCRKAGWNYVISHRSGETEDSFLADFAVAMKGGQIKTGSLCRGERTAKYNRLLEIEEELGDRAVFTNPFQSDMRISFFD